jgi:type VI secretion system protein ImpE
MDALSLYRSGHLRQAIAALGDELKKSPLDAKRRTFLFELLCFAGEYDRAEKHLNFLADSSKEAAAGTLLYRSALHAEKIRRDMFTSKSFPLDRASSPAAPGMINGNPFDTLSDADPRIGSNLEVFIAGSYTWIPFASIEHLEVEKPSRLRDLLWIPARIRTTPQFRLQDLGEVLLPVLAPLSATADDESVALGQTTIWIDDPEFGQIPLGQKLFAVDDSDLPLLEIRTLEWPPLETPASGEASDAVA